MESNPEIVLPTKDLSFKKVFASPENSDVLIGMINDFYDLEVVDVQIENPYTIEEYNKQFAQTGFFETEVDTICTTSDNTKFTMEMQVKRLEYYVNRSLYYLFMKYCSNYGNKRIMRSESSKYSSLFPTYSINILNYDYFLDNTAIHQFIMYDTKNKIKLSDKDFITLGFFELTKQDDNLNQNLKYWREYFQTGNVAENAPDYIKKAGRIIELSNFSKEERRMIDLKEKFEQDRIAREIFVRNEGIEQGIEKGIEKGIKQTAIRMLKMNLQLEQIAELTNLSVEEVSELVEELENQN